MRKTLSVLLAVLLTISLVSCTLSGDGGSSAPTIADPDSDLLISSGNETDLSSEENFLSSDKTDSGRENSGEHNSSIGTSSVREESSAFASSVGSSNTDFSSKVSSSDGTFSQIGSSSQPSSSHTESSNVSSSQFDSSAVPSAPSSSEGMSSAPTSSNVTSSRPDQKPIPPSERVPIKSENYYFYSRLSPMQKQAYSKMLAASNIMPSGFIEVGDADHISAADVYLTAIALKNDHPEIFWLPYAWYIGETHNGQMAILFANETDENASGNIESFTATYVVERAKKLTMEKELAAAVKEIKSKITATDPYEIELQLYDILSKRITYSKTDAPLSYTAYGALVLGEALCEGYARAFQLLLYEFGINSTLITGESNGPHMWNLVEIGGKWYHADLTWDDQSNGTRHSYFNLTDQSISRDHIINADYKNLTANEVTGGMPFNYSLPICNSTDANYYEKTGYTLPRDMNRLAEGIATGKVKSAEVIGWSEEVEKTLDKTVKQKGFKRSLSFEFDGTWAKISVVE